MVVSMREKDDDNVVVQPVLPSMKLGHGVWNATVALLSDESQKKSHSSSLPTLLRYEVFLGAGVASSSEESLDLGWRILDDLTTHDDDDDETKNQRLLPKERAWHDNMFVSSFLHDDDDSSCEEFYQSITVASIDEKFFSFVLSSRHLDCTLDMLTTLVRVPEVAMIGHVPSFVPMNIQAQWIVQNHDDDDAASSRSSSSNQHKRRPWFEAGFDGRGQVIAVSDTGLDVDHCYFGDAAAAADPIGLVKNGMVDNSTFGANHGIKLVMRWSILERIGSGSGRGRRVAHNDY